MKNHNTLPTNLYAHAHRVALTQGWLASATFAGVAIITMPFLPTPAMVLSIICALTSAFTAWSELIERGMGNLRDTPDPRNDGDDEQEEAIRIAKQGQSEDDDLSGWH